jgi:hypothetical protein
MDLTGHHSNPSGPLEALFEWSAQALETLIRAPGRPKTELGPAMGSIGLRHPGRYLREKDSHALLADVEDFSRRQPWAIAAGGLALGFAASRFVKASSSQRYQGRLTVPRPNGVYATPPPPGGNGTGERFERSQLGSGPGA